MVPQMETTPPATNDTSLPESLQTIVHDVRTTEELTPSALRRIVSEANIDPDMLLPWSTFDHSPADSYGRRLVYDGGFFEMMVMSWCPGDVSAIHDHGHTQWGAVQIFGPAEHAVFLVQNGQISTLSRINVKPGQIVYVGHDLVHQMGNRTEDVRFLSFHLYGSRQHDHAITADARVFDLNEGCIQRVDWGVFHALPERDIKQREQAPEPDFPTWLRNTVEIIRRVRTARLHHCDESNKDLGRLLADLFDKECSQRQRLLDDLSEQLDERGHAINGYFWKLLCRELSEAAVLQNDVLQTQPDEDSFSSYAELYDAVIGRPYLAEFIAPYLTFCRQRYDLDFDNSTLLSLGCGTGLMERYIVTELGLKRGNLLGIDISEAMIKVARRRIDAEIGDLLTLDPSVRLWDLAFGGLNVFQYLHHSNFETAVRKMAGVVKPGGYFLGDFITSDHIRWYPNLVYSEDHKILSFRTPSLIEKDNYMFQSSRIINVDFRDGMRITDEGAHERFLPPLTRVRHAFETAFNGAVDVYDAVSLEPIPRQADTCPSTRYLVCARN